MSDDLRPTHEPDAFPEVPDGEMGQGLIRIRGARQHNLKNIDLCLLYTSPSPRD